MSRCLHHNSFGCIAQCPAGCCLHLYFGNVGLRLFPHELQQWRGTVAERCATAPVRVADAECRCLSLPGPTASQVFLFSLEELFLLNDLLVSAGLLLEAEQLLSRV